MSDLRRDYLALLSLGAIWGTAFIGIKLSLESFGPFTIACTRALIATAVLVVVCQIRRERWVVGTRNWLWLSAMGLLNTAVPFSLISTGAVKLEASVIAILLGLGPFFGVLLPALVTKREPLHPIMLLALGIGFFGLLLIVGPGALSGLASDLLSQIMILLASLSYVVSGMILRRVTDYSLLMMATIQSFCAGVALLPVALIAEGLPGLPTITAGSAILYLGILPTAIALVIRLGIVQRQGVGFMSQVGYLVPLFGVGWAALLLGERPTVTDVIALVCILVGLWVMDIGRKRAKASGSRLKAQG